MEFGSTPGRHDAPKDTLQGVKYAESITEAVSCVSTHTSLAKATIVKYTPTPDFGAVMLR